MKVILETARLYLRELTPADYGALCEILQDEKTMYAYEHAFSDEEARDWLNRQLARYEAHGFGLWAVVRKSDGEFLGQSGLTMQTCGEGQVPEIGYLFLRRHWHKGYAAEAAAGVRKYAFEVLRVPKVYSIIRDSNYPSQRVAERNGMKREGVMVKHYYGMDMPHFIYSVENPSLFVI